jgi:phenylacetate-coenzyme A ligase PaaK-like adenylate-forming protein
MVVMQKLRLLSGLLAHDWHDRMPAEALERLQAKRLRAMVAHAKRHCPYYGDSLRGLDGSELGSLPILSKAQLHENWDQIASDRALTIRRANSFLEGGPRFSDRLLGRYLVMATSGSTGVRTPFAFSSGEWETLMAATVRLSRWRDGFGPSATMAMILPSARSSSAGAPMSLRYAEFALAVKGGALFDIAEPIDQLVEKLNRFQPTRLSTFSSMLSLLADEQASGRLRLSLQGVQSSSEVLDPDTSRRVEAAFGVRPHNLYAMTEGGTIAATCGQRNGLHILEDGNLIEVVDDDGRAVAPGTFGSRVLVTNLWYRTMPLIRYEVTDRLMLSPSPCACGLPYRLIQQIEGRSADLISFVAADGKRHQLAPWQIQSLFSGQHVRLWQAVSLGSGVCFRIVPGERTSRSSLEEAIRSGLAGYGAQGVAVAFDYRDHIAAGHTGKVKRFVCEPA